MSKKVIITGATGFVGANLARKLLSEGCDVHLFLRKEHNPWRIKDLLQNVHRHEVNLMDHESLYVFVKKVRPDWIFHLAAYGAYPRQTEYPRMVETNIIGTVNLVEACARVGFEAFVNTGSSSEYGFKDHPPAENEYLEPNSAYAVTKAAATQFCRYLSQQHGIHIPTLRLYSVYGAFEDPERLIPTIILNGLEGRLPPLVSPSVARDFVYVDDVINAYLLAASKPHQNPGEVYNVGTGVQVSIREVVEVACRVMNLSVEPNWGTMSQRIWDTNIWIADCRKLKRELGWHPDYAFEDGYRAMLKWFMENPEMEDLYRSHLAKR